MDGSRLLVANFTYFITCLPTTAWLQNAICVELIHSIIGDSLRQINGRNQGGNSTWYRGSPWVLDPRDSRRCRDATKKQHEHQFIIPTYWFLLQIMTDLT